MEAIETIFITLLNRSISVGWLILAVLVLRLLLKKAPRWTICLLWVLVAVRLLCPISVESALSLIPSAETFSVSNLQYETPQISSGLDSVDSVVNPVLKTVFAVDPADSAAPLYVWTEVVGAVWAVGVAVLLLYALLSAQRLRREVREAVCLRDNIWVGDEVRSPFLLGVLRPRIYLPSGLAEEHQATVIAHERAHLARRDHWWKPLGFLTLAVYWFNPLCWAAYLLLCRDIELACDERVIRQMELNERKAYSHALLDCGVRRHSVLVCPLAFGEVGVKERVKNVLNYKKPTFWVIAAAVVACAVVAVCFLTNPKEETVVPSGTGALVSNARDGEELEQLKAVYPEYFGLDTTEGLIVVVWQMAEDSYSFALMPGNALGISDYTWETEEGGSLSAIVGVGTEEKIPLTGLSAEEMQLLLSAYDLAPEEVQVFYYAHPLSSYIVLEPDEAYIESVRVMLGLSD